MFSRTGRIVLLLGAMALFAGACSGDPVDEFSDDDPIAEIDDDSGTGDDDGGDDEGTGDNDGSDDESGGSTEGDASEDFMTVFGIPPWPSVETDWAPYTHTENEFGVNESVVFEVRGATVEELVAYFLEVIADQGYVADSPFDVGGTIAINISDPDHPLTTAVIQIGETGDFVTVNQNISIPNSPDDDASDEEDSSTSSSDSGDAASAGAAPLTIDGSTVFVDWAMLPSTPFFAPAGGGTDPFFHIHTNPASDGFFLAFEMYTVWGGGWTGELGTFPITCADPVSSTGICPYFDPDGPGPLSVLGGDFGATGEMTINRLDSNGYDVVVHSLTFSDGTTFGEFQMTG